MPDGFDAFATITSSLGASQQSLQATIENYVVSESTATPQDGDNPEGVGFAYATDGNQLPQILNTFMAVCPLEVYM